MPEQSKRKFRAKYLGDFRGQISAEQLKTAGLEPHPDVPWYDVYISPECNPVLREDGSDTGFTLNDLEISATREAFEKAEKLAP